MRACTFLAAIAISSLGSVDGSSAPDEGSTNQTKETCTGGDSGCVSVQTDQGLSFMQKATTRGRVSVGSAMDPGGGLDPETEKNSLASHSICPQDADDEAFGFWMQYFLTKCDVADDDVSDAIKSALRKATSVPDLHGESGKVQCIISAAGVKEASDLEFEAQQATDFQANWTVVEGSAQLMDVQNGIMGAQGADGDTGDPGPCAIFDDTVPRTLPIEVDVLVHVFDLYKNATKAVCPGTNASDLYLVDSAEPHLGKKGVVGNGDLEWETYTQIAAESKRTLHLFYTVQDPSGANIISLSNTTSPAPCEICGQCGGSGLVQENNVEERSWSVEEAKERLAELKLQRQQLVKTEQPVDKELIEEAIALWRQRLAIARHGITGNIKSQGVQPDIDAQQKQLREDNEFGFGDNFHSQVLPGRSVEDHRNVHALSEALVHMVSQEAGAAKVQSQNNLLSNGGFEEGPTPPTGSAYASVSSPQKVGAWDVLQGRVDVGRFSSNYDIVKEGRSLLHLCSNGKGSISQEVDTMVGTEYQLSFSYAASPEGARDQAVVVEITSDGRTATSVARASSNRRCTASSSAHNCWYWRYIAWKVAKIRFKAHASKTTIQFSSAENQNGCMVLDSTWLTLPPFHNLPESYNFFEDSFASNCWKEAYNQGKCGSCWAFASIGALEKQYCQRAKGQSAPSLSREMLVRCSTRNNACGGGNADAAYGDLMEIGGLWQTKCLPYQGEGSKHCPAFAYSWFGQDAVGKTGKFARIDQEIQSRCDDLNRYTNRPPLGMEWDLPFTMIYAQRTGRLPDYDDPELAHYRRYFAKARSHDNVPSWWLYGEDAMMAAIVKYGAIYASFKVFDDFKAKPPPQRMCKDHCWPYGAIYGHDKYAAQCGCGCSGHAIQIIGYGTEVLEDGEELKYWQIENSWGTDPHFDLFNGEPGDPMSYDHPVNAEDKCVLAFGTSTGASHPHKDIDGWEFLLWVDGNLTVQRDVTPQTQGIWQYILDLSPGNHSITFEIHAKKHPKIRGIAVESYGLYQALMRCRGRAYRFDFAKQIDNVELSWNKATRAELIARADALLQQNGINPNTTVQECPSRCRQGRFSPTHPCTDILTTWGRCYDNDYYKRYMAFNCTPCDTEKALLTQKALLIKQLPNSTFVKWYKIIHEALYAPDEPGFNLASPYHCQIVTAGHAPFTRLNATYRFQIEDRKSCDARNSAMFFPNISVAPNQKLKVFTRPDTAIADGSSRTQACPAPLGGQVTLECNSGILRVHSHSCHSMNNQNPAKRGYYRMLRGYDYHQIEQGAAFAIAELGVSSKICQTESWSRWTLCNSSGPCMKGMQNRTRKPKAPLTVDSPECQGIAFAESRPCSRPGFCPQVLGRFMARSGGTVETFLAQYPSASTRLPAPSAGAHMLSTLYVPCDELMHWCELITGIKTCSVLFEAQFQVAHPGKYMLEFSGSNLGSNSELIFSSNRDQKATEQPHYRTKKGRDMEVWRDKMELHRRRRAGKGGHEWRTAADADFQHGRYAAWVLLDGWNSHSCPNYVIRLHSREVYKQAVVFGKSRPTSSSDYNNRGPWIQTYTSGTSKKGKIYSSSWKLNALDMYKSLGINQFDQALTSRDVQIRGQTMLPKAGLFKIELRIDVSCHEDQLWKYCSSDSRRRHGTARLQVTDPQSVRHTPRRRRRTSIYRSGYESVVVEAVVNASGAMPIEFEASVSGGSDAGRRMAIGTSGNRTLYESVPVPNHYVVPNTFELVWAPYEVEGTGTPFHSDPAAVDLGSEIRHASDLELIEGEDLTRVTWPDRDMPFASEYQLQPFEETPPGIILLGSQRMQGFLAEAECRVDAGACVSLVAKGKHNTSANGTLRGFGLQICDVDGDRQYLELFRLTHGSEISQQLGWVHTEFQHPMRLMLVRDMSAKKLKIGYRPDNRAHWATINQDFQAQLHVPPEFWSAELEVGVSMGTERPYRWAEFYNITIDECPDTCDLPSGKRLLCGGNVSTACGGTIQCNTPCEQGDFCVDGHCLTCPTEQVEHANWTCGHRDEVCHDHQGRELEKSVSVGSGCNEPFVCGDDHQCQCKPETQFSLMAMGYECGVMSDGCEGNITLPSCAYSGNENAECVAGKCTCTPNDYTLPDSLAVTEGWNCGSAPSGCGPAVVFGNFAGGCPSGKVCMDHVCCSPATYPSSYECGKEHDACLKRDITFTSAMETWELVFRQTAPYAWPDSYWRPRGSAKSDNFAQKYYWYWRKSAAGVSDYLDANNKFKLKLDYSGSGLPSTHYNVWKQLDFPPTIYCSGRPVPGYEPVEVNIDVPEGFKGMCRGSDNIVEGHAVNRRRRRADGFRMIAGQRRAVADGIITPLKSSTGAFIKARRVELYASKLKDKTGRCPLPNDQCNAEHRCVCHPASAPADAECGSMNDGCGTTLVFNYSGPAGVATGPGRCPKGMACTPLTYRCENSTEPEIEDLRKCMSSDATKLAKELSHMFRFNEGTYSNRIRDGGYDMYDYGNRLRIRSATSYSGHLSYRQQCSNGAWTNAGVGDIKYFTCKITNPVVLFFAGFKSESKSITGFKIEGGLGADGSGGVAGEEIGQWPHGSLWGYSKQVYGTRDPSVNHLVLVPNDSWTNVYSSSTNYDNHEVKGNNGVGMLFYVLWGGRNPHKSPQAKQYTADDFAKVMASIDIAC